MIRVLFFTHNLARQSGVANVIYNLIINTPSNIVKYTILAMPDKRNDEEYFKQLGVTVHIMPNLSLFNVVAIVRYINTFFSHNQFDIVHSHTWQMDKLLFRVARKHGVKKCISHSHSSQLSESRLKIAIYQILRLRLSKHADYCAACSEQAGIALFGKNFPTLKNKLIIRNGIDCSIYMFNDVVRRQYRNEYNIESDCNVIGHVGRFSEGKNQIFLVEIMNVLKDINGNYKLILVGDGDTLKNVKEKVSEYGLNEFVIFMGGSDNVHSILNMFDLFIMPSFHEGLGISAIEAQANGLECILSNAIPKEANLTNATILDLNAPIKVWTDTIISLPLKRHKEYNSKVIKAGYDSKYVGLEVSKFYQTITSAYANSN